MNEKWKIDYSVFYNSFLIVINSVCFWLRPVTLVLCGLFQFSCYYSTRANCTLFSKQKLECIRQHRCGTPLCGTWFVGGIYHTNSPEVISIFTRQSVLHTSHLENSWLLPIIHKWRLTFRLGRGHIHYVEKYHLLMKQWHFLSPSRSAYAYWTASRAHCKRAGPCWHDVYSTSIWSWCILRCKQGFKLYAPPCQWLRVTLAICLSAGDERRGCPGWYVLACMSIGVSLCAHAHIYLLEPHVRFLLLLVLLSPLRC